MATLILEAVLFGAAGAIVSGLACFELGYRRGVRESTGRDPLTDVADESSFMRGQRHRRSA